MRRRWSRVRACRACGSGLEDRRRTPSMLHNGCLAMSDYVSRGSPLLECKGEVGGLGAVNGTGLERPMPLSYS